MVVFLLFLLVWSENSDISELKKWIYLHKLSRLSPPLQAHINVRHSTEVEHYHNVWYQTCHDNLPLYHKIAMLIRIYLNVQADRWPQQLHTANGRAVRAWPAFSITIFYKSWVFALLWWDVILEQLFSMVNFCASFLWKLGVNLIGCILGMFVLKELRIVIKTARIILSVLHSVVVLQIIFWLKTSKWNSGICPLPSLIILQDMCSKGIVKVCDLFNPHISISSYRNVLWQYRCWQQHSVNMRSIWKLDLPGKTTFKLDR